MGAQAGFSHPNSSKAHNYDSRYVHEGRSDVRVVLQARAARLPNRALLAEHWLQDAALEAGCLPQATLLLDLNDPSMTFEMRAGHDAAELANAPATIVPAPPHVLFYPSARMHIGSATPVCTALLQYLCTICVL